MKYINIFKKNNLIILVSLSYIFFWDFFLTLGIKFDIRIVLFLLSFFLLKEIFKDIKNKQYYFLISSLSIFLFIIFHSFLFENLFNLKFYLSLIFLLYIFGIAYYFGEIILNNKDKIIFLFISLFLISILINYLIGFSSNPEPFSCGGIKNFLDGKNNPDSLIFLIHFISSYSLIFNENSHLAMSTVSILIYSLYFFSYKTDTKNSLKTLILIFIAILFLKSSATLIVGSIFSIVAINIFEYKKINRSFIFFSLILIISFAVLFYSDRVCTDKIELNRSNVVELEKINPFSKTKKLERLITKVENLDINKDKDNQDMILQKKIFLIDSEIEKILLDDSFSKKTKYELIKLRKILSQADTDIELKEITKKINSYIKILLINRENKLNKENPKQTSLTSDVFFHAMKVTYYSFLEKPFGWGFQGYELAFDKYNQSIDDSLLRKSLKNYNRKDASSNFFKIITEFGIFGILLLLILLYIIASRKITLENKIFLFPFLITQLIRGAGYFNAGFILILFILLVAQFKVSKNK